MIDPKRLKKRHRAEARFQWYGRIAIGLAFLALILLLASITQRGWQGFLQTEIKLDIAFDAKAIDPEHLESADYRKLVQGALKQAFPEVSARRELRDLYDLVSTAAPLKVKKMLRKDPSLLGKTVPVWLPGSALTDRWGKQREGAQGKQREWLEKLESQGKVQLAFSKTLFSRGDSRAPEQAGFWGSMIGSVLTLLVCMAVAFPLGVMTAVYLEEFASKNRLVDLIEVNINNLAAVPSIVFGLLGLSVYLNLFGLPRSSPVVGGLTLALMILPVIIITTRVSLKSVPLSIRQAAQALGASPLQVVMHHVLPLAMPGIMTGTILSVARAIGETAPLLMIGMVAFIADVPGAFSDPATAMPVQIYLWSGNPEAGFVEKTSAGIMVLLVVLAVMNSLAIIIRKRFEHRW